MNLPPLRASSVERASPCPGSRTLEASQPADERSADSASGDKAHALVADYFLSFGPFEAWPPFAGDGSSEADVAERFIAIVADVFEKWFSYTEGVPAHKWVEQEIEWLDSDFNPILTGHPDVYFIDGQRAFVPDLKSLWGEHTQSVENMQLRSYARLVNDAHGVSEVTVCIVQPRVSNKPQTCVYDALSLEFAQVEIRRVAQNSEVANAPRIPGEKQCKFCRGRAVCPEANATVKTLATLHTREIEPVDLLQMLEIVGPAKKVIAALEGRAKHMLEENPAALPGWTLEEGATRRTVTDPSKAFAALADKLEAVDFTSCCTVKISELETLFRQKTGLKTKDAKPEFERRLTDAGCLEKKQSARTLARAPVALEQPA